MLAMFQFSFLNVGKIVETQPAGKKSKYPIYEIKYWEKLCKNFASKQKKCTVLNVK